jgi:hypothetical protein
MRRSTWPPWPVSPPDLAALVAEPATWRAFLFVFVYLLRSVDFLD